MTNEWSEEPMEYGEPITRGDKDAVEEPMVCSDANPDTVDGLEEVIPPPLQREILVCLVNLFTHLTSWVIKKLRRSRDSDE